MIVVPSRSSPVPSPQLFSAAKEELHNDMDYSDDEEIYVTPMKK
jgi:hypothetical protein